METDETIYRDFAEFGLSRIDAIKRLVAIGMVPMDAEQLVNEWSDVLDNEATMAPSPAMRVIFEYTDGAYTMKESHTGIGADISRVEWSKYQAFLRLERRWQDRLRRLDNQLIEQLSE